jgi:dTDP-4-dehydrorhamnose 3,5-epimerase-like enzyme
MKIFRDLKPLKRNQSLSILVIWRALPFRHPEEQDVYVEATSGSIFVVVVDPDVAVTQASQLPRMTKRERSYFQATRIESP